MFYKYREFNAPVIITVTTPEAERLCLKNGLLFHEMLRYVIRLYDILLKS